MGQGFYKDQSGTLVVVFGESTNATDESKITVFAKAEQMFGNQMPDLVHLPTSEFEGLVSDGEEVHRRYEPLNEEEAMAYLASLMMGTENNCACGEECNCETSNEGCGCST